jgi:hypothetical protein
LTYNDRMDVGAPLRDHSFKVRVKQKIEQTPSLSVLRESTHRVAGGQGVDIEPDGI